MQTTSTKGIIMARTINWFEIPVTDMNRAVRFYEAALGIKFTLQDMGDMKLAVFPYSEGATGGALCQHPQYKPAASGGVVIYLDGGDDLAVPLGRVAAAGGQVVMPKTLITPEIGYMGFFKDSEGNTIALHSGK
jgi:predicted enzyme related to lactoylglutathione lyase